METRLALFHSLLHVRDLLGAPEAHGPMAILIYTCLTVKRDVSTFVREVAPLDVIPKHLKQHFY